MRFFDFLNDIDWSKNIILFIAYIMTILFSLAFYLMPIIQDHKIQNLDYKRTKSLDSAINQNANTLQQNIDTMLKQNINTYQNIRNEINIKDLEEYTKKYINNAVISDNGIKDSANSIKIQNISIQGYTKHTKEIIDFISNLKSFNHSIRVAFPINIMKQKDNLKADFSINVYYSDYKF